MQILVLTPADIEHVRDYLEEVDALIEADVEAIFCLKFIDKHEVVKEIMYETTQR